MGWSKVDSAGRRRLHGSHGTVPLRLVFIIERLRVLLFFDDARQGGGGGGGVSAGDS